MAAVSVRGLGSYPAAFDVPALPARRSRAATRFLARWSAVSILLCGALGGIGLALTPLKSVTPVLAVMDRNGIQGVDMPPRRISGDAAYVEQQVANYVTLRNTVSADRAEMTANWGKDGALAAVDPKFGGLLQSMSERLIADVNAGITQDVGIVDTRTVVAGRAYVVDFDLIRHDKSGSIIDRKPWRAHVAAQFDPALGGTMVNPLGFQIVGYNQEPRR